MLTDTKSGPMRIVLQQIYVNCYVEFVVKNPLSPAEHPGGIGVNNELFELSLEQFVVRHTIMRGLARYLVVPSTPKIAPGAIKLTSDLDLLQVVARHSSFLTVPGSGSKCILRTEIALLGQPHEQRLIWILPGGRCVTFPTSPIRAA